MKNIWLNNSVLVTGFAGFIGSHLTSELLRRGARVVGIDIKDTRRHVMFSKKEGGNLRIIKADIADFMTVRSLMRRYNTKIVFHLAAEALVGKCLLNPLRAYSSNIEGTWNILEAARQLGFVESLIIASSDKAYGSHKRLPYEESAALKGDHPYDVSKSCADLIASTYFHTFRLPVAITRCGNVYGPGDFNFSRLIPDAMRCLALEKELLIRSDGKFVRDYIYVEDIVNAYLLLAERFRELDLAGESFNLSDENPVTVLELIKIINKVTHGKLHYKILNEAKYEIRKQYLSSRKARKTLGWKADYSLENGLKKTYDWYRSYFAR